MYSVVAAVGFVLGSLLNKNKKWWERYIYIIELLLEVCNIFFLFCSVLSDFKEGCKQYNFCTDVCERNPINTVSGGCLAQNEQFCVVSIL